VEDSLDNIFGGANFSGPVPEAGIRAAEDKLGLLFPPSYRIFLRRYGAAFTETLEIAGIQWPPIDPDECPSWTDIVSTTLIYRPDSAPENSIAISSNGCDLTYHLLCSTTDKDFEGSVIEWGPGANMDVPFADSFIHFCNDFETLYENA